MRVLSDVAPQIDAHAYPATAGELADSFRDTEIELPKGTENLGETFDRLEGATFEDSQAAKRGAYSALGEAAIGRKFYADRDGFAPGEEGPDLDTL
jgi:hypothetical protein